MQEIQGNARTVQDVLQEKYIIDYFQRGYSWERQQVMDLVADLCRAFRRFYRSDHSPSQVVEYGGYFLGQIIVAKKESEKSLIDGQQRLTTLTLLLIALNERQKTSLPEMDWITVEPLIFTKKHGQKEFNINASERNACMEALLSGKSFEPASDISETVRTIVERYADIQAALPEHIDDFAFPLFLDWLINKVQLVETSAASDEDAYIIFETMNDRGLSLVPAEMLKGYLLANLMPQHRGRVNKQWMARVEKIGQSGKDTVADFFKTWLRSRYAQTMRSRSDPAMPGDYELIGTQFHRYVRDNAPAIGLVSKDDFLHFMERDFEFYSRVYKDILKFARTPAKDLMENRLESIRYNSCNELTLQYLLLLAPLCPTDKPADVLKKLSISARYMDILWARKRWNRHRATYDSLREPIFRLVHDIRHLNTPAELAERLFRELEREEEFLLGVAKLTEFNRKHIKHILARITDYVQMHCGRPSEFEMFLGEEKSRGKPVRFEIEHIWANHFEQHCDEFDEEKEFIEWRNNIGALLLLPKSFNGSYGDDPYPQKRLYYRKENILAASLVEDFYEKNPPFLKFIKESGLSFRSFTVFTRDSIIEREKLYCAIAQKIWNPIDLLEIAR